MGIIPPPGHGYGDNNEERRKESCRVLWERMNVVSLWVEGLRMRK